MVSASSQSAVSNSQSFIIYPGCDEKGVENHILLHHTKPAWLKLNNIAAKIARCLDSGETAENIARDLASVFGITSQRAGEDVSYILDQLNCLDFLAKTPPFIRTPKLKSVFFHLTTRCNLGCSHCYASRESGPCNKRDLRKDIPAFLVCRLADELAENNGEFVTFSGGEPLLHPEFREIVKYAAPRTGIRILTNGTLIDREWAAFFEDKNINIQISIDGSKKEIHDSVRGRGSFNKAIRAVEFLNQAGLGQRLSLCTTIMKQNLHDLPQIISLAEKLGVHQVRFLPLRRIGRAETEWNSISGADVREYEQFFSFISGLQKTRRTIADLTCGLSGFLLSIPKDVSDDEIWCPVGRKLVIDTDGSAYPCVLMMDNEFRIGNVFSETLAQLINSEKMAIICDALATRRNKIEKCSECNWLNFCQGGCMGQALDHKGTIWETDDFCGYRKRAYKDAFDEILK